MEIRLFQWLAPLLVLIILTNNILRYYRGRADLRETILSGLLWIGVALLAIFPDEISNFIAQLLGFKSNTNAILFLGLGAVLYIQYRLYRMQVQQRQDLTKLTRELALLQFRQGEEAEQ